MKKMALPAIDTYHRLKLHHQGEMHYPQYELPPRTALLH